MQKNITKKNNFKASDKMSYTLDQFMVDHSITQDKINPIKERMLKEIRAYGLKAARKTRNLTQKQLAHTLGISRKSISRIESGDIDKIEVRILRKYLETVGGQLQVSALMPDGRTLQLI